MAEGLDAPRAVMEEEDLERMFDAGLDENGKATNDYSLDAEREIEAPDDDQVAVKIRAAADAREGEVLAEDLDASEQERCEDRKEAEKAVEQDSLDCVRENDHPPHTGAGLGDAEHEAEMALRTRTPQFHTEPSGRSGESTLHSTAALENPGEIDNDSLYPPREAIHMPVLSVDVEDRAEETSGTEIQLSSPQAAEALMKALEEEAARNEEADRQAEAQILADAGSASPSVVQTSLSLPRTATADSSGQHLLAERKAVDFVMAWLPAAVLSVERIPSAGRALHDDEYLQASRIIEDELLQAAVHWIPLPAQVSSSEEEQRSGRAPALSSPEARVQAEPDPQAEGVRGRRAAVEDAYSGDEVTAARRLLDDIQAFIDEAVSSVSEHGALGATLSDLATGTHTALGGAEALLQTQAVRVRHCMMTTLARESAGGLLAQWARGRGALVLQQAYRGHLSRRLLVDRAARRMGNDKVDYTRMAQRLLRELESDQDPEDVFEFITYAVSVLRQLPDELARDVRTVIRESLSPVPTALRIRAADALRSSWRCNRARRVFAAARFDSAAGGASCLHGRGLEVGTEAGHEHRPETSEAKYGVGDRREDFVRGDAGHLHEAQQHEGEVGHADAGQPAAMPDTDTITSGDIVLPGNVAGPADEVVDHDAAASSDGAPASTPLAGNAAEEPQAAAMGSSDRDELTITLPRVADRTKLPSASRDSQALMALDADDDGKSPPELRQQAAAIEEMREGQRQAAVEAEKLWQELVDAGAPRAEVASAEAQARTLRKTTDDLRLKAEALTDAAMRKEDEANELRAESRAAGAVGRRDSARAAGAPSSVASDWQNAEKEAGEEAARVAAADAESMRQRGLEMEEAKKRRAAQAEMIAQRRAETQAANQAKLVEERTELARKTLKLDYSGLGISELPQVIYTDPVLRHVRILWLNDNDFDELPATIGHFKRLTQLRVFKNRLRELPPQIGELGALQILWLQDNLLTTLPAEIECLSNLTLLSLKGNPLKVLPVELSRLKKVRDLEMTTDNVTFPPPAISRSGTRKVMEFLRRADRAWQTNIFDLSDMDLDILPLDVITLFPRITGLYVDRNAVTNIPLEFHVMTQLEELRFDQHLMRSPSMEIWEMGIQRAMEFMHKFYSYRVDPRVDLRAWALRAIPDEVFDQNLAPRLTLLDFSENSLATLPATIDAMTAMRELRLDENKLEALPRSLCSLSNLQRLSITRNGLRAFPDHLHRMAALRFLYLDDNEIEIIPPSICRAHNLVELSLCSNRIAELPSAVPQLRHLRNLLVADNRIERLPFEFHQLTFLSCLDVTGNLIWSPPPAIMAQDMQLWFEYLLRFWSALGTQKVQAGFGLDTRTVDGGVLEMTSFGLAELPPELSRLTQAFSHLVFMNFDYNDLSVLPRQVGKLTNLTRLSFKRNKFRVIPEALGKCYNLTDLDFERNALTFLPAEIAKLTALKRLNVEGNNLTQPPMEVVRHGIPAMLRFLKVFSEAAGSGEVVMSGCDLRAFPMAVVDLASLRRLDLSHNFIGRVPAEFYQNSNASYVDLSYNDLYEIEAGVGNMVSLQTLIVAGNHIEEIPRELFRLTRLQNLVLNQNEVAKLPAEIGVMTWLRLLKLSNNNLESVPLEIGRMQSLEKLVLAYNFISSIPTTIGNMTALRELAISGNHIDALPPIMGVMSGLRELHLSDNPLRRHPPEVVAAAISKQTNTKIWHDGTEPATALCLWMSRVRTARITKGLDAAGFGLVSIPNEVLVATSLHLLRLSVEHNMLDAIPASIRHLSTLTYLNLAHNNLRAIPSTIGTMSNLTVLYLNDNKLMRLPIEVGHLFPTVLRRLAISNNRLETPPKEMLTASTEHLLKYYLTSEVAMLTGVLDWSWPRTLVSMKRICSEVLNWQRLIEVRLDDNDIEVLDAQMCLDMPYLELLSLKRNRLTALPADIAQHTQLRVLCLSPNRIPLIPVTFGSMRNLHVLEIAGLPLEMPPKDVLKYGTENICAYLNALQQGMSEDTCIINHFDLAEVPCEVLAMTNVQVLEMSHMRLTAIPDSLTLLTSLTRLAVSSNAIKDIPTSLAQLTSLTELEFDHNGVSALLPELHVLTRLVWLNVFANPIKTPPFEIVRRILPKQSALQRSTIAKAKGKSFHKAREPEARGRGRQVGGAPDREAGIKSEAEDDPARPRPRILLSFLRALHVARVEDYLDMRDFGLVAWPPETKNSPAITRMHIDNNHLRAVPDDVKYVSKLMLLTLDSNEIKTISPEMGGLTALTELSVNHNKLEDIPACFGQFVNVVKLALIDNAIAVLPVELFQCVALETLLLDNNKITELPPELAELTRLSVLSYEHNPVVNPPEEIRKQGLRPMLAFYQRIVSNAPQCDIKGLECDALGGHLDLDAFELEELPLVVHRGLPRPGEVWDPYRARHDRWGLGMTHLTSLSIKSNYLIELPELISRLHLLTSLVACQNNLETIPNALGALTRLVELDLRDNALQEMPDTTSRLSALRILLLDSNQLLQLPGGLGSLPELRALHAKNNCLTSLPIDLCETLTLRVLDVDENPMRMPPAEIVARGLRAIFDFLSRLHRCQTTQTLDLRALDLDSIDYAILPIPTLKRVLLANNRMTSISGKNDLEGGSRVASEGGSRVASRQKSPGGTSTSAAAPESAEQIGREKRLKASKARQQAGPGTTKESHGAVDRAGRAPSAAGAPGDARAPLKPRVTLDSLEYLNADYNILPELPDTLTTLTSLTELSLVGNQITELPKGLFVLTNLERINLRDNPITQLPLDFGEMSTLRKLEIDLEKLTVPPQEISLDGFPMITRYLTDLRAASRSHHLELMGMKLVSIPEEVLDVTSLTKLILTSNRIRELSLRLCDMAPLTDLWLSRNCISKIPRQLCESLTNLRCLRLDENQISVIPQQICNLSNLLDLRLNKNFITILPLEMGALAALQVLTLDIADMISPYPEVCDRGPKVITTYLRAVRAAQLNRTVDLRGLGLTSFPVEIYAIPSITALHLDDNNLTSLPPSIERLTDLTELTLTNLQLQNLPFVMGAMTKLCKLRLTVSRYMQNPPFEIVTQGTAVLLNFMRKCYLCVRKTGYMNVSEMNLEQLPKEVLALGSLRHLQARDNNILHLSSAIDQMNCIEILHVHGNGLLYLPPQVGELITLVELRLGYNRLKVLPKELGLCFNLRKLSCQNNLLSSMPGEMMSGLSSLLNLNVSCNQLVFLPDNIGDMVQLEKLRMDQNQLRVLPVTIGACTSLTVLSLTCNQLFHIPDSVQECSNLTALHISSNRFRQLPRCVDSLMQLRQLWASNNELIGLPTSLARLPKLVELQVKGSPDLRFPPPDIVTGGREAIINFLMSNMRYEDMQNLVVKEEMEAQFAAARAKDDLEAADLAQSLVAPLQRFAGDADAAARVAEAEAMQLRAKANVHKRFDIRDMVMADATLLPEQQALEIQRLQNKADEDEGTAQEAELRAGHLRADANAAGAKALEARQVADALQKMADASQHFARQKRMDADAQKAISGDGNGQAGQGDNRSAESADAAAQKDTCRDVDD